MFNFIPSKRNITLVFDIAVSIRLYSISFILKAHYATFPQYLIARKPNMGVRRLTYTV